MFEIDGVRATCYICADANAPRCIQRAKNLRPQVVFWPVNACTHDPTWLRDMMAAHARAIGAPVLMANRIGDSWAWKGGNGGAAVYSAAGELLAGANCEGKEEILIYDLEIGPR